MAKITIEMLNETTDSIHANVKDVGKSIQAHLVNLMKFAADTRNVDPMTRFVRPMLAEKDGKKFPTIRTNAIMLWLETYGFAHYGTYVANKKSGKKVTGFRLRKDALDAALADVDSLRAHFAAANKAKWQEMTPEPKFVGLDLDKRIAALVKSVEEKLVEVANDSTLTEKQKAAVKVDESKLATLRTLIAA